MDERDRIAFDYWRICHRGKAYVYEYEVVKINKKTKRCMIKIFTDEISFWVPMISIELITKENIQELHSRFYEERGYAR
ncbi:MAG: hypothetical protein MR357_01225 [Anaeroplasma sp.]|nr:hypothetical protein [Anaeroplasma sp.]